MDLEKPLFTAGLKNVYLTLFSSIQTLYYNHFLSPNGFSESPIYSLKKTLTPFSAFLRKNFHAHVLFHASNFNRLSKSMHYSLFLKLSALF